MTLTKEQRNRIKEDCKGKVIAAMEVDNWGWGPDMGKEKIGEPQEWEDDVLPPGTLLWTPDREALLVEVVGALGKLDRRLVALFSGDAEQLAGKLDAAAQTDPSRLLETNPSLGSADAASGESSSPEPSQKTEARVSDKKEPRERLAELLVRGARTIQKTRRRT